MKNFKTLVIIVILLISVNCVLIGMLWYNNYQRQQKGQQLQQQPPPGGQAFEYLTKTLKLTPAQVKLYDTLRQQHITLTRMVGEEMRLQRDSFFDNLKNPAVNTTAVNALEKRILTNQGRLDSATFYHFRKFRAILDTAQARKFDGIINQVLHMMSGPRPPGPNGPQGGPPGRQGQGPANDRPMNGGPMDGPPRDGMHRPGQGQQGHRPPPPPGYGPPPGGPPPYGPPPGQGPPPGGGPPPNGGPPPTEK